MNRASGPGALAPRHRVWRAGARVLAAAWLAAWLAGCVAPTPQTTLAARLDSLPVADILLFGEQHDAPEHHALEQALVETLAARGRLAAVAMEMAESGRSTDGLARSATEEEVRNALAWEARAWDWRSYGPIVMAAVRAGVPVVGANLPRADMRAAMADAAWDRHLPPEALAAQRERVREGHCDLLPATQIGPMTRIQIARDAAMARAASQRVQPGRTVLVIAGGGHVSRQLGIPTHLPAHQSRRILLAVAGDEPDEARQHADNVWKTPALPPKDHCAGLRPATPSSAPVAVR